MKRFTDAIRLAVQTRNWYAALSMALTLPDVCGSLVQPNAGSGARYSQWFEQWVQGKYTLQVGHPPRTHVFLNGEDCYALRCSYLHEGAAAITHQRARRVLDDFQFITPPPGGGSIHCNQSNARLQLQVDIFCRDIANAVDSWAASVTNDSQMQGKIAALLVVHDSSGTIRI